MNNNRNYLAAKPKLVIASIAVSLGFILECFVNESDFSLTSLFVFSVVFFVAGSIFYYIVVIFILQQKINDANDKPEDILDDIDETV